MLCWISLNWPDKYFHYTYSQCWFGSECNHTISITHWTYLLQILSQLCFQRVAFSGNYEIVAIFSDKTTLFKDLNYKADTGQHFHKSEKSARWRHRHKIIKTNPKTHISPLLTRPQGSQGCQKGFISFDARNLWRREPWRPNFDSLNFDA